MKAKLILKLEGPIVPDDEWPPDVPKPDQNLNDLDVQMLAMEADTLEDLQAYLLETAGLRITDMIRRGFEAYVQQSEHKLNTLRAEHKKKQEARAAKAAADKKTPPVNPPPAKPAQS